MLNNHFYIVCITLYYLPHFATKTYAKSHSAPQTPSCIGHAYGMCKGLQPLLSPNSLLNAGCFSFLANGLYADLVQTSSHSKTISAGKAPAISSIDPEVHNSSLIPHFSKNGWAIPKQQNTRF